ncbi:hypothetical protein PGT21_036865 [Puccinia graminis f. sp. tritici]|uniref:Uncharacterized protein n=2 Tax=Puccinia graminis f. sp. tritici TaxID=56615 RepID=E3KWF0_PUCGT|nr:uncharacterized protein PGTG_14830 [Puccinia graminis f. sp. tritici CRL 75-36-700-3]EFP88625.1 hypothetical protein PGTG_14830 [Puccinia graminis f. sp. tritici CRL 75-36-700-3]KAA1111136.1 hypothetical protein PGT21_036865 [Puccinia graminis f. sp. tritici]KAA1138812.1 hypothetical protein PGTUg99_014657 [Puccinia graminis f. sp. tritici]
MLLRRLSAVLIASTQLTSTIARPQGLFDTRLDGAGDNQRFTDLVNTMNIGLAKVKQANGVDQASVYYIIADMVFMVPQIDLAVRAIGQNAARVTAGADNIVIGNTVQNVSDDNFKIGKTLFEMWFEWMHPDVINQYIQVLETEFMNNSNQFAGVQALGRKDTTIA